MLKFSYYIIPNNYNDNKFNKTIPTFYVVHYYRIYNDIFNFFINFKLDFYFYLHSILIFLNFSNMRRKKDQRFNHLHPQMEAMNLNKILLNL